MSGITQEGRKIIKSSTITSNKLFSDFKKGLISKEAFIKQYEIDKIENKKTIKLFKKKRAEKRSSISYHGYKNKRTYLFWVGVGFFILVVSIRHASKVLNSSSVFEKIEAFIYCSISGFMFTWAVKNFNDYNNTKYMVLMLVSNIAIFLFAFFILRHYKSIETKLRNGIKLLIVYVFTDLFNSIDDKHKKEVFINNMKTLHKVNKTIE